MEKSLKVLSKVRISGGGRCNVTHACFDPKNLATHYPRGSKELVSVFSRFQAKDTIDWFEKRGVKLKIEEDGRMFPITDSSETVINCLMKASNAELKTGVSVKKIQKEKNEFILETDREVFTAKHLVLTTGSFPAGHEFAKQLGHTITPLVPSLFTFNVPSSPLLDLSGITIEKATVSIINTSLCQTGPLLLTHFGFSGPVILRLSAWGARELNELNYQAKIKIDWTGGLTLLKEDILSLKKKKPSSLANFDHILPKNLAKKLFPAPKRFSDLSNRDIEDIINILKNSVYELDGKTTYKSEFVTAGGIARNEVDFKTMQSKLCPGLYFAGEILDIDGITGGFNFQNAWSTAYLAANSISRSIL